MQSPIACREFSELITAWFSFYSKEARDYECTLPQGRIGKAHLRAFECMRENYSNLDKPSPFKKAACVCMGINDALPIQLKRITSKTLAAGTVDMMVVMDNARLALCMSLQLLDNASFECAPEIAPPHNLDTPSKHFVAEFTEALAGGQLPVQGVALSLELIFYLSEHGGRLRGRMD